MIDTGANIHIISSSFATSLNLHPTPPTIHIKMVTGITQSIGRVTVTLSIKHVSKKVILHVVKNFHHPLLLGLNLGDSFNISLNLHNRKASLESSKASEVLQASSGKPSLAQDMQSAASHSELLQQPLPLEPDSNKHNHSSSSSRDSCTMGCTPSSFESTHDLIEPLIEQYSDLFAQSESDIGRIDLVEHHIRIKDDQPPVAQRPYRVSPAKQDEIRRHVNVCKTNNFIRESSSPYSSPVTLAPKSDGGTRLCVDYRRLNQITIDDKHPLPRIQDVIDRMRNAKFFTVLDIKWGYWHVPMYPPDIEKTAFTTADGHFEWLVMPFGLKNAPATFQRIIQKILGPLLFKNVINYLDDIIIFSPNMSQHIKDIISVFEILRLHHIKLKYSKCSFAKPEVHFLGSIISFNHVRCGTQKLKAVLEYPHPTEVVEVSRFLGLANWFRGFIPRFADLSYPLTLLLRKGVPFKFGPDELEAFNSLKTALASEPVLTIFDPEKTCELFTDASRVGIAGILMQRDSRGMLHPISYFSKRLTKHQENWHTTELESLALVESVEHFEHYLLGHPFIAYTDHAALSWMMDSSKLKGKAMRWFIRLSQHNIQIIHKKGKYMQHVDALSRAPVINDVSESIQVIDPPCHMGHDAQVNWSHTLRHFKPLSIEDLKEAQIASDLSFVAQFVMKDGVTYVNRHGSLRAVVPESKRRDIIHYYHMEYGHPGISKTTNLVSHYYWWPRISESVTEYCRSCPSCQMVKVPNTPTYGQLQPLPSPPTPLELVAMDTMIMGASSHMVHAKNIQVLIDHHSRYAWAVATPKNTLDTAKTVLLNIFRSIPWPQKLLTDQGSSFHTKKFREFLASHGTQHIMTTAYHPQTNGMVERLNRVIKERLAIAQQMFPKRKWSTLLDEVIHQYNKTPHDVTGYPPVYLMFGMNHHEPDIPHVACSYEPLAEARSIAQARTIEHQNQRKARYDKKHPAVEFLPGQLVRRKLADNHPSLHKLSPRFEGPFEIVSRTGPNTYKIKPRNENSPVKNVNVSQLRPYFESETQFKEGGEM